MAYTSHVNKLAAKAEKTPRGIVLRGIDLYVYPDGHGNIHVGEAGLPASDPTQLCAYFANLVGVLVRRATESIARLRSGALLGTAMPRGASSPLTNEGGRKAGGVYYTPTDE